MRILAQGGYGEDLVDPILRVIWPLALVCVLWLSIRWAMRRDDSPDDR